MSSERLMYVKFTSCVYGVDVWLLNFECASVKILENDAWVLSKISLALWKIFLTLVNSLTSFVMSFVTMNNSRCWFIFREFLYLLNYIFTFSTETYLDFKNQSLLMLFITVHPKQVLLILWRGTMPFQFFFIFLQFFYFLSLIILLCLLYWNNFISVHS